MNYLMNQPTQKKTSQGQPIPRREKDMARNNAGGFAFKADSFQRLERFLILGTEGGTYYVGQSDLTKQNVDNVRACIEADGPRAVETIKQISVSGRAAKNDPALYALALAASYGGDEKVRASALAALPHVARTGTHLFHFCAFIDGMRGWGPALRKAVAGWYSRFENEDKLAYQLVKYRQRDGWTHADVLRLCHVGVDNFLSTNRAIYRWATGKGSEAKPVVRSKKGVIRSKYPEAGELPAIIESFETARASKSETVVCEEILYRGLTREMIPTEHLNSRVVWEALLEKMPVGAMIRNLSVMSNVGLLAPFSSAETEVLSRLKDEDLLKRGRVHPLQVLAALLTYRTGKGQKGKLTWTPSPKITDALNEAFYLCFSSVRPTGKRFYLGIDVSGSMTRGAVAGMAGLTPNMGAAAMAMLIARTEPHHFIGGFSTSFINLGISSGDRLDSALAKCQQAYGGTDCAVAIKHALANGYPVDAFVVITDGETWAGDQHASQAIREYREKTGNNAKLIVINMVANRTSLNAPEDSGSLDVVGFDAAVPSLINSFMGAYPEEQPSGEDEQ